MIIKGSKAETIQVCIRMRPLLTHEDMEFWNMDEVQNSISTINSNFRKESDGSDLNSILSNKEKEIKRVMMDSIYFPQNFNFDKVYCKDTNSQQIYKEMCRGITKSVVGGYNGTIFMYGQTTSGKTFTMLGSPSSPGILPCALRDIFNLISREENPEAYTVLCSYIEIYNENLHDLLTDSNNLKLIEDSKQGVIVSGAKRIRIKSFDDGISLKDYGEENRKYRETLINEYSSRSHTIFQIFIEYETPQSDKIRFSNLNLVDLAGSERLHDYDNKTEAFGETGYINKSLFVLANVVNKLAQEKNGYIPYRDSKLTRLLSQSLGGNCKTLIICTVSPAAINYYQTLSTLRFGMRAKILKTKPNMNEYMDDKATIEFYKTEIKKLQEELNKYTRDNKSHHSCNNSNHNCHPPNNSKYNLSNLNIAPEYSTLELGKKENDGTIGDAKIILEQIKKTNESLANQLINYKDKYLSEKEKNDIYREEINKIKQLGIFPQEREDKPEKIKYSKEINKENFLPDPINNHIFSSIDNNSTDFHIQNQDNIFLENLISQFTPLFENSKNYSSWKDDVENMNSDYLIELANIQNKYKDLFKEKSYKSFSFIINSSPEITQKFQSLKSPSTSKILTLNSNSSNNIKEIGNYSQFNPANKNTNLINFNNDDNFSGEKDDVIRKIQNMTIFSDIRFFFVSSALESFENNLKTLKQLYESKLDTLEKNMDYYKSYLENFYRKKIQLTKNNHLDNIESVNEMPIMTITFEHNQKLKTLRELYDQKLRDLETVNFIFKLDFF
jgi:hypothetical protein